MVKKITLIGLSLLLALSILPGMAMAVTIEQVDAKPPEFNIYLYEPDIGNIKAEDISAFFDEQAMTVAGFSPVSQLDIDVCYIYALDISASINSYVFKAAKDAVLQAYDELGANEKLLLITFGDVVETKLTGGETRAEVVSVLDSLTANNMNTDFNGAIKRIVELAKQQEGGRKIGVIFSDGVDDIYAGFTRNELYNELRSGAISLNAMCVQGVSSGAVSQFGEVARLSGGELFMYSAGDVSSVLAQLLQRVDDCFVLSLRTATNITDGKAHVISFKLGNLPTESVEIAPTVWIKDEAPPTVEALTYDNEEFTVTVEYSEAVTGAQEIGNYDLKNADGESAELSGLTHAESNGKTIVTLKLKEQPYEGEYTLYFSNISDLSMEQNKLENSAISVFLETGRKEIPLWVWIVSGAAALLIAALVVALIVLGNKKKKLETEERLNQLENRSIIAQGEEAGNQLRIPKATGTKVMMNIFDGKGKKYSTSQDIVTSLFIGKHSGNDLVIEDSRISRQHTVIEQLDKAVAIQDLESTNGTFVNGARLQPGISQRLAAGDEITLGDTTIRIISIE